MKRFLLIVFASLGIVFCAQAQKTDTVYLYNGDRLIGEIKGLQFDVLSFSTTSAGTIKIKWHYVTAVYSNKLYEIKLDDGSHYYGSLDSNSIDNNVFNLIPGLKESFDLHSIAVLIPIKRTFKARIDGNVDLGFSYTKASNVTNLNFGGTFQYRATKNLFKLSYDIINTFQGNENETARKQDLRILYDNYFHQFWFFRGYTAFEQNSELGLESRMNVSPMLGLRVVESHIAGVQFSLGPQYSYETPLDDEPTRQNFEALITGYVIVKRVLDPELDISVGVSYVPSFSLPGRNRFNTDASARIELLADFFLKLTFYQTFDSDPVAVSASNNDYGITTTISYKF